MKETLAIVGVIVVGAGVLLFIFFFTPPLYSRNTSEASNNELSLPPHISSRFAPPGQEHYWNDVYQFSLFHPDTFTVEEYKEENRAITIVFQDKDTLAGFQLYIVPYFAPTISEEQFRKDMPSGVRKNEQPTDLDGIEAVAFIGEDSVYGETLEVWGIHYGYLYELTAQKGNEELIRTIVSSWKFF